MREHPGTSGTAQPKVISFTFLTEKNPRLVFLFNFSKRVDYFGSNQALFVNVAGKPRFSYLKSVNWNTQENPRYVHKFLQDWGWMGQYRKQDLLSLTL